MGTAPSPGCAAWPKEIRRQVHIAGDVSTERAVSIADVMEAVLELREVYDERTKNVERDPAAVVTARQLC